METIKSFFGPVLASLLGLIAIFFFSQENFWRVLHLGKFVSNPGFIIVGFCFCMHNCGDFCPYNIHKG